MRNGKRRQRKRPSTASRKHKRGPRRAGTLPGLNFELLFQSAPNPYMVLDRELRYVAVNQAYLAGTASRREDLIGKYVFDAFPDDPENPNSAPVRILRESFARVVAEGKVDTIALMPYRMPRLTSEGVTTETRYWSATHTPLLDDTGKVAFILQHAVDVSELQSLSGAPASNQVAPALMLETDLLARAQHVQEANQRLHALFMQAPVAIGILRGPRFIIELANPTLCFIWGRTPEEVLGKPAFEAVPDTAGQGFEQILISVRETGKPFVGTEVPLRVARGKRGAVEELFVNFVFEPLFDGNHQVEGIIAVAFDVTEGVKAHQVIEDGVRIRDEFISVAGHELRTPLTPLALRLAQIKQEALGTKSGQQPRARQVKSIEVAERQVMRLASLVDELLDVSRLSAGQLKLKLERMDLAEVVREVVTRFEPEADRARCRLELHAEGPVRGVWDRLRLEQLVANLLTNAIKYGAGKPVRVTVEADGALARIIFQDQGIGIAPEALRRIFEKFERAVSERYYGGLGLGLWVGQQIVHAMGGEVRAESELGRGATFTVELPLEDGDGALAQESREPDAG